jgi:hypothetical protein
MERPPEKMKKEHTTRRATLFIARSSLAWPVSQWQGSGVEPRAAHKEYNI